MSSAETPTSPAAPRSDMLCDYSHLVILSVSEESVCGYFHCCVILNAVNRRQVESRRNRFLLPRREGGRPNLFVKPNEQSEVNFALSWREKVHQDEGQESGCGRQNQSTGSIVHRCLTCVRHDKVVLYSTTRFFVVFLRDTPQNDNLCKEILTSHSTECSSE